jgi:starch synthase
MSERALRIVHVASEFEPVIKVGGLADMVAGLVGEQVRRGHRITVVAPGFRDAVVPPGWVRTAVATCNVPWGMGREPARIERLAPPAGGLEVLLVSHAGERRFFDRPGIYDDPTQGRSYPDNAERFLFFCRAAVEWLKTAGGPYDVIHAHDHQAAWVPCLVRTHEQGADAFRGTAVVFTIHNLGYQGIHDPFVLGLAGFGGDLFYPAGPFEYWGRVNYMKVGIVFADLLNTVSPRYAEEVKRSEEFGCGLEGLLRRREDDLRGILNGVDTDLWNPGTDVHLPAGYDAESLDRKALVRTALVEEAGFGREPELPVIGMVTRLAEQKGLDLIEHGAHAGIALEARFVVLGSGEPRYEAFLARLAEANPGRVCFRRAFDDRFAHRIVAGSDIYLMPSRYEPCGLNQMYAMRYGTPPVVRAVGGLADTVDEFDPLNGGGTGFRFHAYQPTDLAAAVRRSLAIYRQPELWRKLQRNGMARDFSWSPSADLYDAMYGEAMSKVGSGRGRTLETVRAAL